MRTFLLLTVPAGSSKASELCAVAHLSVELDMLSARLPNSDSASSNTRMASMARASCSTRQITGQLEHTEASSTISAQQHHIVGVYIG